MTNANSKTKYGLNDTIILEYEFSNNFDAQSEFSKNSIREKLVP